VCLVPEPKRFPSLDLTDIARRTLGHYDANAERFWSGTKGHDVRQNLEALLEACGERPGLRILDFGCGPGRDLVALRALGHVPVGLDGCESFVRMARAHSGCEVLHQSFFDLRLPTGFDGIFANASLFHVPQALLPTVLAALRAALLPNGVLFCSNPRSFEADTEGFSGDRYGTYLTVETWRETLQGAGMRVENAFLRPSGKPETEQPWIAMVARKSS
jgi:SAM-dependent methyltransferase